MTMNAFFILLMPCIGGIVDRHFELASNGVAVADRRTLSIAVWAGALSPSTSMWHELRPGFYKAEATFPALLHAMDRAMNDSVLPDYVNVK